uniref:Uncharacterized protein n=1 Tax=Rhizophora mucronata TaxID=61149 RepID=A0A2P2R0Z2_RHIMU
MINANQPHQ